MDKQKQIEEMAKDMLEYAMKEYPTRESVFTETKLRETFYRVFLTYAETLYNAGCRKIPENAVVLTSGDKVDMFDSEANGFMTSPIGDLPLNIDGMRKAVDEIARLLIVQAELQDLNAKYYNEAKDLRRNIKQASKGNTE